MRKCILIVDDDQAMLNSMKRDLRKFKNEYEVLTTTNVNEVARLIEEFEVELLITDIFMPGKDGLELIWESQQKYPQVKIITMSGGASFTNADDHLELSEMLGSSYTLKKPFSRDELISAIKHVLGERRIKD